MPAVVHIVIGHDDDRKPRVGVVVEVNEDARRNIVFVPGKRFGRPVQATVGQEALGTRHGAPSITVFPFRPPLESLLP
jgi:hypothetical protein